MARFEDEIKEFAGSRGVDIVGVAGPERLSGPPSLDPAGTMANDLEAGLSAPLGRPA